MFYQFFNELGRIDLSLAFLAGEKNFSLFIIHFKFVCSHLQVVVFGGYENFVK